MERFTIRRTIGSGGMGVVYEAHDHDRDMTVALKSLRELSAARLYRFKREFRALADIAHPNLVTLYEFVATDSDCFFTMEYVDGVSFLEYVRPGFSVQLPDDLPAPREADDIETQPLTAGAPTDLTADSDPETLAAAAQMVSTRELYRRRLADAPLDEGRLRAALGQLAGAVFALHQAGKLHRDIKPSNVLVSHEGRVALCDFGLATEIQREQQDATREFEVVGTAAYMSPQQAANVRLTEASDWYAVGVMLFEALTARLPFEGEARSIVRAKQLDEPRPPWLLERDLPEDLASLCHDLIRLHAEDRPSGVEVLRRLDVDAPTGHPSSGSGSVLESPLVGRDPHLRQLRDAFAGVEHGASLVLLRGSSGMGKSLLLRRFYEQVQADDVVVLSGRCHVSESVPYKALDTVIDALSAWLLQLPRSTVNQLLPRDVHALARLFPVLKRVEAVVESPNRRLDAPDPQETKRRAFAALRELFHQMAKRYTVVVSIDDMQWGDLDSAALLIELLRPADPPPVLCVCSYRSEDAKDSPLVRTMVALAGTDRLAARVHEVSLDPLSHGDSCALVKALLQRDDEAAQTLADRIAGEAGGSPLFIDELVRHADVSGEVGAPVSLDDALRDRVAQLPEAPQELLTLLCVAGGPITQEVASLASALGDQQRPAMARLRAERLVIARGIQPADTVEVFHDRIREAVVDQLPADEHRQIHRRLAVALERLAPADPVPLMDHWQGAGDRERTGRYAAAAAEQALASLAFDRAARLFLVAMELQTLTADETRQLLVRRGDALANAGRGADAAAAYTEAASTANAADALEYQRRAAEELLRSGHIEDGMRALRGVADAVGTKLPTTPRRALASLLLTRLRIRLRGLRYRPRDASQVSAEDLRRIDVCASAAVGLGMVNNIFAATLQSRALLLALRAGEPHRLSNAVAMEAVNSSTSGAERRVARLLALSKTLATKTGDRRAIGIQQGAEGLTDYQLGRFRSALENAEQAAATFRDHCDGVTVELNTTRVLALWSLFYLGELSEFRRRVPLLLAEAENRGDRFAVANLCTGIPNFAWLLADDAAGADEVRHRAMKDWPTQYGYHLQHYSDLSARQHIALYSGDPARAWQELSAEWPNLSRSLLLRIKMMSVTGRYMRARSAVAAAHAGSDRAALLQLARRDASRIERRGLPCSAPLAHLIRAGAAGIERRQTEAAAHLAEAERGFEAAEMTLFVNVCQHRRGAVIRGETGRRLVQSAHEWMTTQEVADPKRVVATLAPGFGEPPG